MDFELTETQQQIRDLAREFALRELAPIASQIDETGEFPIETVKKMGALGLMGIEVPEAYGGAGLDTLCYVLAMEEICKVSAAHGTIMSVNNSLVCLGLKLFGSETQKREFLVPLAGGQKLGAFALTEPQSGSDAGNMQTTAVRDNGDYRINGRKSWVSSGPYADLVLLVCATDRSQGSKGTSAFIIDTSRPGLIRGKIEPKLGIRASATCELLFENYTLPVGQRLGEEGMGFKIALTILDAGRIGIAAQALGIAQAAYEASVAYARQREAFGSKIAEFQAIQWIIADMATRIEAARLLVYNAALKKARGDRYGQEASMAKVFAAETAMWVTTKAIQVHGGIGYSKELPIERYFRDAKITEIYEGTSEIQRTVIARHLLGQR
ncbi:MAG: acyl-CoA dehydrogenase family protein [Chloroflexi bacterium]|nr:acyl-CoA dehydrogenase family protein [Chloroflexota bacterium]